MFLIISYINLYYFLFNINNIFEKYKIKHIIMGTSKKYHQRFENNTKILNISI
jgi:hypothetical protein